MKNCSLFLFFFFSFLREYLNWSNRRIYIYISKIDSYAIDFLKNILTLGFTIYFLMIRVCFICINKMRWEKENLIKWVEISWEITWNMKNYNYANYNSFIEFQYMYKYVYISFVFVNLIFFSIKFFYAKYVKKLFFTKKKEKMPPFIIFR